MYKPKMTFEITNLTIHVNSFFICNTQLPSKVSNYTKICVIDPVFKLEKKRTKEKKKKIEKEIAKG